MSAKFRLGIINITAGVYEYMANNGILQGDLQDLLARHVSGDWGDICKADALENDLSVQKGFRVLSAYHLHGKRIWIITEADRSSTTVLFPEEY